MTTTSIDLGGGIRVHPGIMTPELVPAGDLTEHPQNPRRGDVDAIGESLDTNDLHESGIRWRRGLNDDTIVTLDILKTGYWCTAESHMLGIQKVPTTRTKRLAGGMTDFYANGGFLRKSAELVRLHPDCTKTVTRYGRIHHQIDYSQFKQRLIPVDARQDA